MTYYTGLDRVAKRTGYPVVEVAGWKTRGNGHMGTVRSIIAHHTAGGKSGNAPSLNVVTHGRAGLSGPLSQFVLGRDGTIYVVAAGLSYHAGRVGNTAHSNTNSIGIEAENTGLGEEWSDEQLDAYAKLCAELVREFRLSVKDVLGHKEIAVPKGRKIDPNFSANGIDMDDFRKMVQAALDGRAVTPAASTKPAPVSKPKPATKPKPAVKASAAIKSIQTYLASVGYYKGLLDGVNGPMTKAAVKAYQKGQAYYPGLKVDGVWGPWTEKHFEWTKKLQAAMNKWQGGDLIVDGNFGKVTKNRVTDLMKRNHGGTYKGLIDGIPGAIFCKMIGIPKHPTA